MIKRWITNLQKVNARGVTPRDILMVKLIIMEKNKADIWQATTSANEYPARLTSIADTITWHIYNNASDTPLIIKANRNGKNLGFLLHDAKRMYIIIGCRILTPLVPKPAYQLYDNSDIEIAVAETIGETQLIRNALLTVNKKTSVKKSKIS